MASAAVCGAALPVCHTARLDLPGTARLCKARLGVRDSLTLMRELDHRFPVHPERGGAGRGGVDSGSALHGPDGVERGCTPRRRVLLRQSCGPEVARIPKGK